MRFSACLLPVSAALLVPCVALAQDEGTDTEQAAEEISSRDYIPFVNRGGLRDWHSEGRDVIYFQDRQKRWFRAELMAPSSGLRFAQAIGLDTSGPDRLDKWSTVYIDGRPHTFTSFEPVAGERPWEDAEAESDEADG